MASDERLVDLVRQGRGSAFEAIYDRHFRAILSFCRHMLGSQEEAEDAVQHTFLAAYNDLIASDREMHLRAWLFTIARNRCYSVLRARREQPVGDLDEPATEGLAAQVERRQDLRDLVLDLGRLPDDQRAALVLSEMDSLSHEQIGQILEVPKDKVKALVFQARESLIASRAARETDCSVIREQLANLHGGALRRSNLRRHLKECPGCREFRSEVDRQRRAMRVLLPVAPTLALKETILGATAGGTASGTAAAVGGTVGGGTVAGSVFKGGIIKGLIGAALAGVGTAGTIVAVHDFQVSNGATSHQNVPVARARSTARSATAPRHAQHAAAVSSTSAPSAGALTLRQSSGASRSSSASWAATVVARGHRSASATPRAVLHPFSSSGLSGSKSAANPLAPSSPTTGVTPPATGSGSSGNAPYLGPSAFGKGTQPAPSSPASSTTTSPPTTSSSATTSPTPVVSSTPTASSGTSSTTTHTTTGGGHYANPVSSGNNGGPATSHGTTGASSSSGTTKTSKPSSASTTTASTPSPGTTTTTTTTTTSTTTPTQPTGSGGRSGGSGGTGTGSGSGSGSGGYGGGAPGGGGR